MSKGDAFVLLWAVATMWAVFVIGVQSWAHPGIFLFAILSVAGLASMVIARD